MERRQVGRERRREGQAVTAEMETAGEVVAGDLPIRRVLTQNFRNFPGTFPHVSLSARSLSDRDASDYNFLCNG